MSNVTPDSTAAKRRTPRWIWVLLIGSLALNLLIVGAIGGSWARYHRGWGGPWGGGWHRYGFMRSLPDDRRDRVRVIMKQHRETLRPLRREAHGAWRGVIEVLKADEIDKAKLEQAIASAHEAETAARKRLVPMILEVAAVLTPEERRQFIKRFERRGKRRWWRRRHDD